MDYSELLKRAKAQLPVSEARERWEVPRPVVNIAGRRTFVKNFTELAKALRREPGHMAKFLFKELAAPGNLEGDALVLQGKFGTELMAKRIGDYANEFVLCKECGKPDTDLLREDRLWSVKCQACGARRPVRALKE
jgi:translation initiation factor 2 subunit 2